MIAGWGWLRVDLSVGSRLRALGRLPTAVRYALTCGLVIFALWLGRSTGGPPFLFLLPTVLIVAVLFDHGCSLFGTLLAAGLATVFLFDPGSVRPVNVVALAVFVVTGIGLGAIVETMRKAIDGLSEANLALLHAAAEEQRRTRLFDAVIEGSPDVIYVKDPQGRFVHVNTPAATVLGTTVAQALGRSDRDFLTPEAATAIEGVDRQIMESGKPRVVEERIARPGTPARVFLSSKFAWTGAAGEGLGLIGISRDITARKDAEVRLKSADAQKELLLEDINHRVKNHLQTVAGLMTVAGRRATRLDEARDIINDAVSRLSVLAQVYTRLQVGGGASAVDAKAFIVDLCHDLGATLTGVRPVAIRCEVEPALLDSSRSVTLGLIINELVQNALKYAFPGDRPGQVRVTFQRDGETYRLRVADDGIGFDATAATRGSGHGRRLITAMVQQLSGTLAIDSSSGTRFEISFPIGGDVPGPT